MTNPTMTATPPSSTALRPRYQLLYLLAGAAVAGVLVGFALTASAANPTVPGIVPPSTAVVLGLPISRAVLDLASVLTVGMSFLPKLVGPGRHRGTPAVLAHARMIAVVGAGVWFVAALVSLALEEADTNVGRPVTIGSIGSYVREIGSGQALVVVAVCALAYVVIGVLAVRRGEDVPVELRITVAMFALLPLSVAGHAAFGNQQLRDVGLIAIELHVVGAVSWLAGLLAIMLLVAADRPVLAEALPRFSKLATGCVFLVAFTGMFSGWYELYSTPGIHWYTALFTTGYGLILIGKLSCVGAAGLLGGYTRFKLLPKITERRPTALATWATMEIAVLGIAFGLAAVLVRSPVVGGT
jgi:putative copper resistance protein D